MSNVVQLRDGLTDAQTFRALQHALDEVRKPCVGAETSLCQDLAELMQRVKMVAALSGATVPRWKAENPKDLEGEIFQRLFDSVEAIFGKAVDKYPVTQCAPQ